MLSDRLLGRKLRCLLPWRQALGCAHPRSLRGFLDSVPAAYRLPYRRNHHARLEGWLPKRAPKSHVLRTLPSSTVVVLISGPFGGDPVSDLQTTHRRQHAEHGHRLIRITNDGNIRKISDG